MIRTFVFSIFCCLCAPLSLHAQLLNRIINRAVDKVEDAAEEKAAELIADQITRAMNKKIDQMYGDLIREAAKQDSMDRVASGDTLDWEAAGSNMMKFLQGMSSAADVRPVYTFTDQMDGEVVSGKDSRNYTYHYNPSEGTLAIEDKSSSSSQLIVVDMEKNTTVLFTTDDEGNKYGQALPNMDQLVKLANEQESNNLQPYQKGTKSKTLLGYKCQSYISSDDENTYTVFVTDEIKLTSMEGMQKYMARFNPSLQNNPIYDTAGVPLQTIVEPHKKRKEGMTFTITDLGKSSLTISKEDYDFSGAGYAGDNE